MAVIHVPRAHLPTSSWLQAEAAAVVALAAQQSNAAMPKTVILNAMLGQGHLSPLVGIATQLQARDDYEVQFLVNAVDRDAVVKQFASMAPAAAAARFEAEGAVAYDDPTRFEAIFWKAQRDFELFEQLDEALEL